MKPNRFAAVFTLLLTGCASGHPLDCLTGLVAWSDCAPGSAGYERRERAEASDDVRCRSYGAQPGDQGYIDCRTTLSSHRDDANEALLRAVLANSARVSEANMQAQAAEAKAYMSGAPHSTSMNCMTTYSSNMAFTNCQ